MCEPSIEPTHCERPHLSRKPVTISFNFRPTGKFMYFGSKTLTIASYVSLIMQQTMQRATPNKCVTVQYSHGVARTHSVIATCRSTDIALRSLVFCLLIVLHCCNNKSEDSMTNRGQSGPIVKPQGRCECSVTN